MRKPKKPAKSSLLLKHVPNPLHKAHRHAGIKGGVHGGDKRMRRRRERRQMKLWRREERQEEAS